MSKIIDKDISTAVSLLKRGDVVAIPTETVYGLSAAIDRPAAIERIFSLKERPFFDPLIVHIANLPDIFSVVESVDELALHLAEKFWPGPLTLILPKRQEVNPMICSGLSTVAVRMPRHVVALSVIRELGVPLAAPSANKFGRVSPTSAAHVRSEFPNEDLFIVDGGICEVGLESTVLQVENNHSVTLFRPGGVSVEELKAVLGSGVEIHFSESNISPGNVKHHYMPKVPLVILPEAEFFTNEVPVQEIAKHLQIDARKYGRLVLNADPRLAARELYAKLRDVAESGVDFIVVEKSKLQQGSYWEAIWDRLSRAASLDLSS